MFSGGLTVDSYLRWISATHSHRVLVVPSMLTPADMKNALSLYKRYKCDTEAYRQLAAKNGISVTDLNQYCWRVLHAERQRRELERKR